MIALFKIRKHINLSKLKLDHATKIFDSAILPIITYGCEVWGVYNKFDFESWDKTHMEKVHLRFCKLYLELNRKASNHAVRAEMGRFPILISIIKQILKYNVYLRSKDNSSIVKQAFLISEQIDPNMKKCYKNRLNELRSFINARESYSQTLISEQMVDKSVSSLKTAFIKFWKQKLQNSSKLDFYLNGKLDYAPDAFIDDLRNCPARRDLLKLRTSNHSLFVETGRYTSPKLPREERICKYCNKNEIEDELHLIHSCELYLDLRDTFLKKLHAVFNINKSKDSSFVFEIFSNSNKKAQYYLAQFVSKCFSIRKTITSMAS